MEIKNDVLRNVLAKPFGLNISTKNVLPSSSDNNEREKALTVVDEDLGQRACRRLVAEEINKQQNLEDVVRRADEILQSEKVETIGSEATDQGWVDECLEGAGKAYNNNLKDYWAKLLAGEIKHPGSYSLRAIDFMKKLSQRDAEKIRSMCRYVLYSVSSGRAFILRIDSNDIVYNDLRFLMELRLIDSSNTIISKYRFKDENSGVEALIHGDDGIILTIKKKEYDMPIYPFTQLGHEILSIIDDQQIDYEYLKESCDNIVKENSFIEIAGGKIERNGKTIRLVPDERSFKYPK